VPGEFRLIDRYFTHRTRHTLLGVGDDAALIRVRRGHVLAISVDMLVEGRHFFKGADPDALGHKTLAVNLSDLAAMGATPRWATLALALPRADERWLAALGTPQQVALRCRIVLAVAAGETESAIAAENEVNRKTVRLWRERFGSGGLQALWEIAPGRGRKPAYDAARVKAVIDATLQTSPKEARIGVAGQWRVRRGSANRA